jgi:hypothetical protein
VQVVKKLVAFLGRTDGSLQHKAIRSGIWVGLSSVAIAVLTFGRGIVLARLLSPDVFGLMAVSARRSSTARSGSRNRATRHSR